MEGHKEGVLGGRTLGRVLGGRALGGGVRWKVFRWGCQVAFQAVLNV